MNVQTCDVVQMQNVSMASVNVCQSTTVILISIAAPNVCSVLTVIKIKHAFEENVLILASAHVDKTPFVKLLITSLCAVAFKDFLEMHLLYATQLKVLFKYFICLLLRMLS